jgi:integrase
MSTPSVPKYSRQRETKRADRAYVRIGGRKIKLGVYGSPESKAKYAELISGIAYDQSKPERLLSDNPTVNEVLAAYLEHAQTYYRDGDGNPTSEYAALRIVARWLRREVGTESAENFGPKRLKVLRQTFVDEGWVRKTVNDHVKRVRRIFSWAASEEIIAVTTAQALDTVKGLGAGRSEAKESDPVLPVTDSDVKATLDHLPEVVADMVRLQLLCGCRPGELLAMRPCDLDRSGAVWFYKPAKHKTARLGHKRIIALGPKAQEILLRYLARGDKMYCFRPQDSEQKRLSAQRRVTPLSCGNRRGNNRVSNPKRSPGEKYTTDSYRRAVERAAKRANVTPWTPHRLRHSAATLVRQMFGLDAAQSVLGHRNAKITEVYAELHAERAAEVAAQIG